jgi:hypothetical protein
MQIAPFQYDFARLHIPLLTKRCQPSERSITHPSVSTQNRVISSIQCRGNVFANRQLLTKHRVFGK